MPIVTSGYETRPATPSEVKQIKALMTPPKPITFTRKVARNRGNARIWIEGKALLSNGFNNGDRFDCDIQDDAVVLAFTMSYNRRDGDRKIAGKPERPIIDINTARLNSVLDQSHYLVEVIPFSKSPPGVSKMLRITPVSK